MGVMLTSSIGCWGSSSAAVHVKKGEQDSNRRLRIVVTTGMVADLVRHVAGNYGNVTSLIGSGGDPHLYKPLLHDIKKMNGADVVFYSGLTLEGRMQEELKRANTAKRPVVAITERLEKNEKEMSFVYFLSFDNFCSFESSLGLF